MQLLTCMQKRFKQPASSQQQVHSQWTQQTTQNTPTTKEERKPRPQQPQPTQPPQLQATQAQYDNRYNDFRQRPRRRRIVKTTITITTTTTRVQTTYHNHTTPLHTSSTTTPLPLQPHRFKQNQTTTIQIYPFTTNLHRAVPAHSHVRERLTEQNTSTLQQQLAAPQLQHSNHKSCNYDVKYYKRLQLPQQPRRHTRKAMQLQQQRQQQQQAN